MTPSDPAGGPPGLDPSTGRGAGPASADGGPRLSQPADRDERRLHPLSWLFVLLTQLRHALVPLVVLVFVGGRGEDLWGLWFAAFGAVLLALHAIVYAFAFRYRIGETELVVREGIFDRTERHVPFVRIQNVTQRRNPLHRLFGVAELRVESAGGAEPEARMSVVTVAEAAAIERLLRERRAALAGGAPAAGEAAEPTPERLLALPLGEIVRLGLVSNRGMVAVAAAIGALVQFGDDPREIVLLRGIYAVVERAVGKRLAGAGPLELALAVAILVVGAFVALRVLSVAVAIVRHHGFVLERAGARLGTEEGLLTRVRAGAAIDRIQRLVVEESLPMRWFGRRSARVDVAGGLMSANEAPGARFRTIAPIARPEAIDAIVREVLPALAIERDDWRPLHPRAWRRLVVAPSLLLAALAALGLLATAGPLARTALADWPWIAIATAWPFAVGLVFARATGWTRFSCYALDARTLAFRDGWLTRRWRVVEIARIQGLVVVASPLDRWNGMATLIVAVAGTPPTERSIEIPFLPAAEAQAIAARLRAGLRAGPSPAARCGSGRETPAVAT
jgi:putative membrane protein